MGAIISEYGRTRRKKKTLAFFPPWLRVAIRQKEEVASGTHAASALATAAAPAVTTHGMFTNTTISTFVFNAG